ncbi:MAG: TonB-dependent receptor, partial [Rhodospirillaceae bacterium]
SLTEQIDAGLRYTILPGVQFVAGVFDIKKPYFELDPSNVFTNVGSLRHRGIELSLAGEVIDGLSVVAGTVILQARVSGQLVDQGAIGKVPKGADPRLSRLNLQYGPESWRGFSVDAQLENINKGFADQANLVELPDVTTLDLGARYSFNISDVAATLRFRVENVTNTYAWQLQGGNALFFEYIPKRRYSLSLAADF